MEYKKEWNKFSFGFGSQKVAGAGNLAEAESAETSTKKLVASVILFAAACLLKFIAGKLLGLKK
ncbi:MAG: hypothetical protein NC340_07400 [Ruminococcus flavefaciens]|nr:hypothetical protein [Ruminococcus flavefaciens]MCM1231619.1 hypothetical protein [Ruminococcus flavefaciens]